MHFLAEGLCDDRQCYQTENGQHIPEVIAINVILINIINILIDILQMLEYPL